MTGGATLRFVQRAGWNNAMKYLLPGLKFDGKGSLQNESPFKRLLKRNIYFTRAVELIHICKSSPLAIKEIIKTLD